VDAIRTLQGRRVADVLLVARVAVVGDLVWNCNACRYELRKDLEAEMIWRRDPSGPAIVCTLVNRVTMDIAPDRTLMIPPMTPTVSTSAPFGATRDFVPCPLTALNRLMSAAAPSICSLISIVPISWKTRRGFLGIDLVELPGENHWESVESGHLARKANLWLLEHTVKAIAMTSKVEIHVGLKQLIGEFAKGSRDGRLRGLWHLIATL
jgi:hypothetical protein